MKSSNIITGSEYPVVSGKFKGKTAVIIDSTMYPDGTVRPDGSVRNRQIVVQIDGRTEYLLPRLLSVTSGTQQSYAVAPAAAAPQEHAPVIIDTPMSVIDQAPITDPMDERLDMYRPSWDVLKHYVSRKIGGAMTDIELLMSFYNRRDSYGNPPNIMLVGDTQGGKTMLVQVLACVIAKAKGYSKPLPIFTLSGSNGITDYDMFGQPTVLLDESGRERMVWLPGQLDLAARVESILYLDESNMMPERVTSSLHSFTDDRRTFVNRAKAVVVNGSVLPEQVPVNPDTFVIGTYNDGYRGAGKHNEAFANRFRHLPWGYDDAVERKLIKSATVLLLGAALREAREMRQISTPVGTKALMRLVDDINVLGVDIALYVFGGMFPANERIKVETIITDRSIKTLLAAEKPVSEPS